MKKILTTGVLALSIFFAISCEENMQESAAALNYRFVPVFASAETATRTVLQNDLSVTWEASDKINVFYDLGGSISSAEYSASDAGASVQFDGSVPDGAVLSYAVYPYNADATLSGNVITTEIPVEQTAVSASFGSGSCVAAGKIDASGNVTMYNVCGLLKFTLTTSDITSILISGTSGECLAGQVAVTCGDSSVSSATDPLYSSPAVTLSNGGSPIPAGTYFVAVAPGSLAGVRFLFTRTDGKKALRYSTDPTAVSAGKIRTIGTIDAGLEYHTTLTIPLHFRSEAYLEDNTSDEAAAKNWPFNEAQGQSKVHASASELTTKVGNYPITFNGTREYYLNSKGGIQFYLAQPYLEEYWQTPALAGYKLIGLQYRSHFNNTKPSIVKTDGSSVLGGGVKSSSGLIIARLYSWLFSGTETNTAYRVLHGRSNGSIAIMQFDMEYLGTENTAIQSVTSESATAVTTNSATLSGSLSAVNAIGSSEFDCVFFYRIKGSGEDYSSITADTSDSDFDFSVDLSGLASGTTYEYYAAARLGGGNYTEGSVQEFETSSFCIDLTFHNGSRFTNPFSTPAKLKSSVADAEYGGVETNLISAVGGYTLKAFFTVGIWSNTSQGLCMGSNTGDYLQFPALEGKTLAKVGIIAGNSTQMGNPAICPGDSSSPVIGGEAKGDVYKRGEWFEWNLSGTAPNTAYRLCLTSDSSFFLHRLILTYE